LEKFALPELPPNCWPAMKFRKPIWGCDGIF
jgi:hypothetical protein